MAKRTIMEMEAVLYDVRRIAHLIEIVGHAQRDQVLDDDDTSEVLVMVGGWLLEKQAELMEIWEEVRH